MGAPNFPRARLCLAFLGPAKSPGSELAHAGNRSWRFFVSRITNNNGR